MVANELKKAYDVMRWTLQTSRGTWITTYPIKFVVDQSSLAIHRVELLNFGTVFSK